MDKEEGMEVTDDDIIEHKDVNNQQLRSNETEERKTGEGGENELEHGSDYGDD